MAPAKSHVQPHAPADETNAGKAKRYIDLKFPAMLLKVIEKDNYCVRGTALIDFILNTDGGMFKDLEMKHLQSEIITHCNERTVKHTERIRSEKLHKLHEPSFNFLLEQVMRRVDLPVEGVVAGAKREREESSPFIVSDDDLEKCLREVDSKLNVLDARCRDVCAEMDRRDALASRMVCEKIIEVLERGEEFYRT